MPWSVWRARCLLGRSSEGGSGMIVGVWEICSIYCQELSRFRRRSDDSFKEVLVQTKTEGISLLSIKYDGEGAFGLDAP